MSSPGFPLLDLALPVIDNIGNSAITEQDKDNMRAQILAYINKEISFDVLSSKIRSYPFIFEIVNKIKAIMDTENIKAPQHSGDFNFRTVNKHVRRPESYSSERNKTRHWSEYEDNRLLMGVRLYGLDNWNSVAKFVGNGRLRCQCMQRWSRGLDPRISKKPWTKEEENQLFELVEKYTDRAWTKIASILGNRSDVQCRYKYIQLCRAKKNLPANEISGEYSSDEGKTEPIQYFATQETKIEKKEEESNPLDKIINETFKEIAELENGEEKVYPVQQATNNSTDDQENKNLFSNASFSFDFDHHISTVQTESNHLSFFDALTFNDINLSTNEFSPFASSSTFF